jgi:hypothetical protein
MPQSPDEIGSAEAAEKPGLVPFPGLQDGSGGVKPGVKPAIRIPSRPGTEYASLAVFLLLLILAPSDDPRAPARSAEEHRKHPIRFERADPGFTR